MQFFIDESGHFRAPQQVEANVNFACITAAVLTDEVLTQIEERFGDKDKEFLRRNAKDIIGFLNKSNCIIFTVITDSNLQQADIVEAHRDKYINGIRLMNHPDFLLESVNSHIKILRQCSHDEYIYALLMIKLLENIFRGVCCESTDFLQYDVTCSDFICDNVNARIVPTIKYLPSFSMNCNAVKNSVYVKNKQYVSHLLDPSGRFLNAALFFKNINFRASKDSMGIRVVDVISNQIFRVLREETPDYEISMLQKLFSNPYSFDALFFNMDYDFIEKPLGEKAFAFYKGIKCLRPH